MRKFLLSLIAITTICTNVWGWDCGGTTVTYSDGNKLTVTKNGNGQMTDYNNTLNTNWGLYKSTVTTLVVEEGVTHIGAYCFDGFNKITSVKIPSTVTSIGNKAFNGCTKITKVYASTPNAWASIEFQGAVPYNAHPFGASTETKRNFYFYGKTTASDSTKYLAFRAGITTIQPYAFYKATGISEIYIPGTVTTIGDYAFYCNITGSVAVNNQTPPSTSSHSFSFKNNEYSSKKYTRLYVPQGSGAGYSSNPWYNGTSSTNNAPGAHYIGRSGDANRCTDKGYDISGTGYVYPIEGDIDNIHWTLNTKGELLLEGHGTISAAVSTSTGQSDVLPWYFFKDIVNTAIIRHNGGDISALNNILQYCDALDTIIIEQNTIPTATYTITNNYRKSTDKAKLLVKANASSITSANESATWNVDRIQIGLNEAAVYSDVQNNAALVTALGVLDLPFNLQLNRSMGKTTEYFSFCSPIDMDAAQIEEIFGADAQLHTMTGSSYNEETEELALDFEDRTTIDAGVPYLIKPSKVVSNPVIEGVTADDLATTADEIDGDHVTFYGTLAPRTVDPSEADGKMIILLGGNELTWANGGTIGGMRAFWLLDKSAPAGMPKARIVMRIGKVATGVESIQTSDIRSQKILRDGQLYLLYEGKMYDVRGQLIK